MKRSLILSLVFIFSASAFLADAQRDGQRPEERQKWLAEMRSARRQFLTKELSLTKEQQEPFFTAYEAMDQELTQVSEDLRELENKVKADDSASDIEVEAAARALYEQRTREGAIEMKYYETFRDILQPRQLLNLKSAERKFTQQLVRQHGRSRGPAQGR